MLIVERNLVEAGEYQTTTRSVRVDTVRGVGFINYADYEGKEIPASTFRLSHPTGIRLFMDALIRLGYKAGDNVPEDTNIAIKKTVTVKCIPSDDGQFLNTALRSAE